MNFLAMFLQSSSDADVQRFLMMAGPIMMIAILIGLAIILIPFWFICKKAGFRPGLRY